MEMTNLEEYGVVGFGEDTDTGVVSENDRPIIDSLFSNIIDERCQHELRQTIPSSWNSSNFGIDIFVEVLRVIERNIPNNNF